MLKWSEFTLDAEDCRSAGKSIVELGQIDESELEEAETLIVLSREIDEFGTFVAALHNDYEDRTYYAELPDDEHKPPEIISISRWNRDNKRYPMWADIPKQCWDRKLIPISLLRPGDDVENEQDECNQPGSGFGLEVTTSLSTPAHSSLVRP